MRLMLLLNDKVLSQGEANVTFWNLNWKSRYEWNEGITFMRQEAHEDS